MNDKHTRILIGVVGGLTLAALLWVGVSAGMTIAPARPLAPQQSDADVSYPTSIQGRLTSNDQPVVDPVSVTFRIYDGETSTTPVFTETQTIDPDDNGLFNTALHVDPPLGVSSITDVWLGIQVGSDPEMTPRLQSMGASYAFTLIPGAGISGTLYITDSTNAMFSVINMGNGFGVRGYSADGTGVFGSSDDGYAVVADGDVLVTGQYTGTFPSPAYDSEWQLIIPGNTFTFTHNLGGFSGNYVVDMRCWDLDDGYGINQIYYGGGEVGGNFFGAHWQNLTSSSIQVRRRPNDPYCDRVRVRIWVYQ